MKTYVWVSFAFMGWAYWEMSGGADFEPETRVTDAETPAEAEAPDLVARADTAALLSISSAGGTAEQQVTPVALPATPEPAPELDAAIAEAAALDLTEETDTVTLDAPADPAVTEVITEFVSLSEPQAFYGATQGAASQNVLDLREVAGSRVNMRQGPGTSFGVITSLPRGTEVEVLETDANGWVRLRTVSTGQEGWMAERLLTN